MNILGSSLNLYRGYIESCLFSRMLKNRQFSVCVCVVLCYFTLLYARSVWKNEKTIYFRDLCHNYSVIVVVVSYFLCSNQYKVNRNIFYLIYWSWKITSYKCFVLEMDHVEEFHSNIKTELARVCFTEEVVDPRALHLIGEKTVSREERSVEKSSKMIFK